MKEEFQTVREALDRYVNHERSASFHVALSSIERHVQDMAERLEDFEYSLANWEAAYPISVFGDDLTKDEQRAVTEALVAAGFTSDRVHASWGRHIVRCFTEAFAPVRAALPAREKGTE